MKIILINDVKDLGSKGDSLNVADGFARNYLVPKGLALPDTDVNRRLLIQQDKEAEHRQEREKTKALQLAHRLKKISCTIEKQVGDEDRLYGSVSPQDIVEALKKEDIEIDKNSVIIDEPIKVLGIYNIPIRLHSEVEGKVKVWVVKS